MRTLDRMAAMVTLSIMLSSCSVDAFRRFIERVSPHRALCVNATEIVMSQGLDNMPAFVFEEPKTIIQRVPR